MIRKPHENSQLAKYVERRVLELKPKKTQAEIAADAGYINQNMITMTKQGRSKVALDRVPALARALECDPAFLMRLSLEQAIGRTAAQAVVEIFGDPVSANERAWIEVIREASGNSDPRLTARSQAASAICPRRKVGKDHFRRDQERDGQNESKGHDLWKS